jgi:Tol biopolymer transport system component/predicted Ser/Thr protein kinase
MHLSPGTRLGPYEILSPLGAGGMGEVYRAKDTKLKREIALKVLPEGFARDPERMVRFQREAEVLAALNHPNIAAIYGLEEDALIMELVEGETLSSPLPIDTALRYAKQIAEALEYAHERGVIHRDLKPANVKVTSEGIVKLLDFGLAKAIEIPGVPSDDSANGSKVTAGVTRVSAIMGTAAYMSPEQARGDVADRRADIWSFGAVLYEMLSGKRAFDGKSVSDTLADVLKVDPDLNALPASTHPSIRKLVRRCLTKDRKQRLQAIGEARIGLEEVLSGAPQEDASAPGAGSRQRLLPWVAAAGVLAIVAAVGWWTAWRSTRPVDNPLLRLSVDLGPDAIVGAHITAAISPDGTRLAFLARGPNGTTQLATRLLDQPQATLLSGTEGAGDPFFSPDGQWIGFFAEGKMKKVSVRGSAVITLCDAPDGRGAAWGEDGNIIATLSGVSGIGLSRVAAAGGTPQVVTNPVEKGEATHRWPQILPGGQAVLFMANTNVSKYDDSSIEVLSLKTGAVKVVQRGGYFGRYLPSGYLVYIHQGTLFGVPFDLTRLEVSGTPTPLLEDVAGDSNTAGGQFDFSRNGTFVYLSGKSSTGTWALAWLDSAGKMQPLLAAPGVYYEPRLSPDGKRLAFSSGTDIEIYDWGRETRMRLTLATQAVNNCPVWTPDGKYVVFVSEGASKSSLQWLRADGAGEAQLLLESKNRLCPYSFSPDGKRVAFGEWNAEKGSDLWTLPLDTSEPEHPKGGKPELFLRTPSEEFSPSFSPDGRWISYSSTESGRSEVFVRPFPAGGASGSGKWLISTGGGRFPRWSRDSRELFYEGLDNRIMAAAYTAKGDSFAAEKPRPWSNTQLFLDFDEHLNLDVAPYGRRFVVTQRADSTGEPKGSVHVTFLLNFFDEVRRRVSTAR